MRPLPFLLRRMIASRQLIGIALLDAFSFRAAAQVLHGRVTDAATGVPVRGAEILVAGIASGVLSDSGGNFRFAGIRPGDNVVRVRKIGYAPLVDTVTFSGGQDVHNDYQLAVQTAALDTMRTVAQRPASLSPALRGFEERRLSGGSGRFIPETEMRKYDDSKLSSVILSRVPGLMLHRDKYDRVSLVSTRKTCSGPAFSSVCTPCFPTMYVDGVLIFNGKDYDAANNPAPEIERMLVKDFAGVEFYAGSGVGPPEFNTTGSGCGTLLLWSREK